ncbi:RNA polymerase III RPC4-domain-containing protein [Fomes fomentarius]|nr:RNA polymerase III RPC4-domain-containing protein [Fomes fomentarius]
MSEQHPSGSGTPASSGTGSGTQGKAIASLAKKQSDVTRLGTQKLKFVPTLPPRRAKESRGRGLDPAGEGRGVAPRAPAVEMTASGPFAMGPALAGMSGRRTAPRSNFAPIVPQPPGADGKAKLGAGLTQTTAPSLKKERESEKQVDEEVYSDPDDGVEIVDMENVRQMDWMAPESLRKERDAGKKRGLKMKKDDRVKQEDAQRKEVMDVDRSASPEQEVNVANAVDLSESEEEEELEDIIDDFAQTQEQQEDTDIRQERLYFFQFPHPFPAFQPRNGPPNADLKGKGKAEAGGAGEESAKKVTFADDTKPPAADATISAETAAVEPKLDGVVGQLEIYESGAVKLRMQNGILMDVTAATQPSFLQHAVHLDASTKRLCVLGEVNRRFVVTPDLDSLLTAMEVADAPPPTFELGEGLLIMDTT